MGHSKSILSQLNKSHGNCRVHIIKTGKFLTFSDTLPWLQPKLLIFPESGCWSVPSSVLIQNLLWKESITAKHWPISTREFPTFRGIAVAGDPCTLTGLNNLLYFIFKDFVFLYFIVISNPCLPTSFCSAWISFSCSCALSTHISPSFSLTLFPSLSISHSPFLSPSLLRHSLTLPLLLLSCSLRISFCLQGIAGLIVCFILPTWALHLKVYKLLGQAFASHSHAVRVRPLLSPEAIMSFMSSPRCAAKLWNCENEWKSSVESHYKAEALWSSEYKEEAQPTYFSEPCFIISWDGWGRDRGGWGNGDGGKGGYGEREIPLVSINSGHIDWIDKNLIQSREKCQERGRNWFHSPNLIRIDHYGKRFGKFFSWRFSRYWCSHTKGHRLLSGTIW